MSSILKVDQLQDSGGNAIITSDGAGNLTAGTIPAKTIGTGAVLQVVNSTTSTQVSVTGLTFTDSNLSASITPSATSSKILIILQQSFKIQRAGSGYAWGGLRLLRGATQIWNPMPADSSGEYGFGFSVSNVAQTVVKRSLIHYNYLDSPSTTSATTYKTQIRGYTSTGNVVAQEDGANADAKSSITLMEIAG